MRNGVLRVVPQMKLDEVAGANANEAAGNAATERPERVVDTVGVADDRLDHVQVDDDLGRVRSCDGRRREGGRGRRGDLFAADLAGGRRLARRAEPCGQGADDKDR